MQESTAIPAFSERPVEMSANADIGTHERVVEIFRSFPGGSVLDAPAGTGALAFELAKSNFRVTGVEFAPSEMLRKACAACLECDLNEQLPFADASFDYVSCVEGIEHLENPFHTIGEFGRVMKTGGSLIITTPNIMVLSSRLRFLLTGFFNKFPRPLDESCHDPSFHINPVAYPELRYVLRRNGFVVKTVTTNRVKSKEWLIAPLVPLIYLFTKFSLSAEQSEHERAARREILQHLMSRPILFGQALIVVAQKVF